MSDARGFRRVILSAYACHPTTGSEPGVGWEFLRASLVVAEEVWIVTRTKNVGPIVESLDPRERVRTHVIGHDLPVWAQKSKRLLPIGTQLYYLFWQFRLVSRIRELDAAHEFEVGHHVTFSADWLPVALSRQNNFPVVWGPVGGSTIPPRNTWAFLGLRGLAVEALRLATGRIGRRVFGNQTAARCSVLLAYNRDELRTVGRFARKAFVESTAAMDPTTVHADNRAQTTIVGVGRLLPWKGWALAIDAFAQCPKDWNLILLGRGPDEGRLRSRARCAGVADRVQFVHRLGTRDEVFQLMRSARAVIFPSLRESGGWVVAEAIANNTPVVVLDIGGPSEIVSASGGIAIAVADKDPGEIVADLALALQLAQPTPNPDRWNRLRLPDLLSKWWSEALAESISIGRGPLEGGLRHD